MKPRKFLYLALFPMMLGAQDVRDMAPLKNWSNPLYWRASQAERDATAAPAPQLQFSPTQVSTDALSFVAITPCRLLDTLGTTTGFSSGAPWNAPIAAGGTLTIPVQTDAANAACGTIPSIAQAYSVNVTLIPVSAGQVNVLTIWPSGMTRPVVETMSDRTGLVLANAAIVAAGTPSGGISVFNSGPAAANVIIDLNGFFAAPTDLNFNTAIGTAALASDTTGNKNTATGQLALNANTTGSANMADGFNALGANTSGSNNTASGSNTLQHNTTGSQNTAVGQDALFFNTTGMANTAAGAGALASNTIGGANTAVGNGALNDNTTGNNNTVSGQAAMLKNTTGCCNTASGQAALQANSIGSFNTAIGGSALQGNTSANNNTAVGQAAMLNTTTGCCNVAVGQAAMRNNTTGTLNVGVGGSALQSNTTGTNNTSVGTGALSANSTGGFNTALGQAALFANTTGVNNTAVGVNALFNDVTGNGNTATGFGALINTTGFQNTAFGLNALGSNTSGTVNIGIGVGAGNSAPSGNNNSIYIGSPGTSGDGNGTIMIGTQGTQTGGTFIAGISGATSSGGVEVFINTNGQLGTLTSSGRFKEQISDMGDTSSKLLQLRPVTFYYKPEYDDGLHTLQYGLVAEEVAKVYPEMVAYGKDGKPWTVRYQLLAPMLLNELQKQAAQNQELFEQIHRQAEENRSLEARLAALEARLTAPDAAH